MQAQLSQPANGSSFNVKKLARPALAIALSLFAIVGIWFGLPQLATGARVAFITFAVAIIGWTMTDIEDTFIALAAAIVFAVTGLEEPGEFFETLGDPMIWMMLASFIVAAAVKASGLSQRLAVAVTLRSRSVKHLFVLITLVLIATTFVIPSTSGRAALMLPVFVAISGAIGNPRIVRALALLFPSVILLSAIASLTGAGAHLIAADVLMRTGGEYLGFGRWLALGLPFALMSCFATVGVIMWMFLTPAERNQPLTLTFDQLRNGDKSLTNGKRWSRAEVQVFITVLALVVLWATESVHGINNTLVAIVGALLLSTPNFGVIDFKKAMKEVDWGMLVFMAATLELGEALTRSGGAQWLVEQIFASFQGNALNSPFGVVALVTGIGLLSHLVITSRSSRASVIIPMVILLAVALGFSTTTFAFLTAAATGFCLTLPISAKPMTMFSKLDQETFQPKDLLKMSGVLLPVHFVLLVAFAFLVWPNMGLTNVQAAGAGGQHQTAPRAPEWVDDVTSVKSYPKNIIADLSLRYRGNGLNETGLTPSNSADVNSAGSGSSDNNANSGASGASVDGSSMTATPAPTRIPVQTTPISDGDGSDGGGDGDSDSDGDSDQPSSQPAQPTPVPSGGGGTGGGSTGGGGGSSGGGTGGGGDDDGGGDDGGGDDGGGDDGGGDD
jgi:anion transporter